MEFMNLMIDQILAMASLFADHWNGEIAAVCLAILSISLLLYRCDKNPDVDFQIVRFMKTNGQEDPYKAIYLLFSLILGWGFIIMTKNKDMDVWKLIVFCAYAFGPPMFNAALKVLTSVFGKQPVNFEEPKQPEQKPQ